jgi:hypothetical protein
VLAHILRYSGRRCAVVTQYSALCSVGRPTPRVTWWRDGIEIDNSDESLSERRVRNVLRLEKLERRHLNTLLTCKASNNDMVSPLTANVSLDMYREYRKLFHAVK